MSYIKLSVNAVICGIVVLVLSSCSGNGTTENKTATKDSSNKPRWIDPQRGKIWGKVNYVQIPLTAIEDHIMGPVKSERYADYKISDKDSSRVLNDSGYNVYDKFGHLIDQNEYDKEGKLKWHCVYTYDAQNKAVLWDVNIPASKMLAKVTFKYDSKGNKIEENSEDTNKKYSDRITYKYDDKSNMTEENREYGVDKRNWLSTYKYDNRGFQVEYTMRDETGKMVSKTTQEYDDNGNKLSSVYYHSDTAIAGKWTATLDNKGRTTERKIFKGDGSLQGITKYKYDDGDNITENINYKADGSVDTTGFNYYNDFEYDSKGNAVKETGYKLRSGKKAMTDLTERKFEYY